MTFAHLFDRPTPLEGPDGIRNWVRMFAADALSAVPETHREAFFERIEAETRGTLFRDGKWVADYRRLRVVAIRVQNTPRLRHAEGRLTSAWGSASPTRTSCSCRFAARAHTPSNA